MDCAESDRCAESVSARDPPDVAAVPPAGQDYTLSVNGVRGGPFAFDSACLQLGGCFTVQSFGLSGNLLEDSAVAWVDSISLVREIRRGTGGHFRAGLQHLLATARVSGRTVDQPASPTVATRTLIGTQFPASSSQARRAADF